ncbi:hypothetical protein BDF20DRAFT_902564 [Mycotypha africana]|uniref:uncharacterized protein n=1 Tax=Mycotypha africana TaxID=64632 RepID=UPI0022FFFE79|nr:uncharacterized protein BDF20DRAFT_902564 [Mycotypha africana]KAI8967097.1 hypothetical protein BDF20DRAFT_902564 [Mycotypha africana]
MVPFQTMNPYLYGHYDPYPFYYQQEQEQQQVLPIAYYDVHPRKSKSTGRETLERNGVSTSSNSRPGSRASSLPTNTATANTKQRQQQEPLNIASAITDHYGDQDDMNFYDSGFYADSHGSGSIKMQRPRQQASYGNRYHRYPQQQQHPSMAYPSPMMEYYTHQPSFHYTARLQYPYEY